MKKIKIGLLSIMILTLMCGCINIKTSSNEEISSNIINNKKKMYNVNTQGFKYYLPRYMTVVKKDDYNQIVRDSKYKYYLYADIISYYNKIKIDYEEDNTLYYSKNIDKGNISIIKDENNYILKVAYNYSSIQVSVKETDIKEALSNSLIILTSVKYNDDAIKTMIDNLDVIDDIEIINIFEKEKKESNYLDYDDTYNGDEEKDYDPDVIN